MDYTQEYKQKLVSADEAVKVIKSGDWVDYGWCTGTPDALDKALAKRTDELTDWSVVRKTTVDIFTLDSGHMPGVPGKVFAGIFTFEDS